MPTVLRGHGGTNMPTQSRGHGTLSGPLGTRSMTRGPAKRSCTNRLNLPVSRPRFVGPACRAGSLPKVPPGRQGLLAERRGGMAVVARWLMGVLVAALLVAVPFVHYRAEYAHHKRLRVVVPDVLYRSGQMTAEGFRDAVARYGVRT